MADGGGGGGNVLHRVKRGDCLGGGIVREGECPGNIFEEAMSRGRYPTLAEETGFSGAGVFIDNSPVVAYVANRPAVPAAACHRDRCKTAAETARACPSGRPSLGVGVGVGTEELYSSVDQQRYCTLRDGCVSITHSCVYYTHK